MRVLWITYNVFEPFYLLAKGNPTKSAAWTTPLFYSLYKDENIQLGSIATIEDGEFQKEEIDNVIYYSVPIRSGGNARSLNKKLIDSYLRAIKDFKPDIIHVHGVENNFGLLRRYVDSKIPIVCSIQGLINPSYEFLKYSVATIHFNKYKSLKNWLGRGGVKAALKNWRDYSVIEKEILEINQYFIGRTLWDKSQLAAFNPCAYYFHGEELLRKEFHLKKWSLKDCTRHRIFISSAAYPLKGFHILLKAVSILKKKHPDIKIVAPLSSLNFKSSKIRDFLISEDYSNYLKKEIIRLNLVDNLKLLPKLTAEEMANEYKKAHVFVLASFIENSSNALGEAMLIGTPSVVSSVGGVSSIVKDEESALIFSSGDYAMLAYQIQRVFESDELANKLNINSKSVASRRHNVDETTQQYLSTYKEVIQLHKDRE